MVSQEFLNQMKAPVRRVDARVTIDYTDPTQDQNIEVAASERADASYPAQTADFATEPTHKWAALDGVWVLDGTWHLAPVPEDAYLYQMGWWSAQVAGEDGRFSEPYPTLILTHPAHPVTTFQVVGDSARGEWPTEFAIRLYGPDGSLLRERSVTGNAEIQFYELLDPPALDVTRQELEIRAWSRPSAHAKILEFFTSLQETYEGSDLLEIHLLEESESGSGVGTGGVSTNEITVRLVNRGGRFDVTNPQSPFRELLRPNRRIRAWLGLRGAGDLWGDGWYAPFDRDLTLSRQDGTVIEPLPDHVVTLRPGEGRFGGAVAVEEGTTNCIVSCDFETWASYGTATGTVEFRQDPIYGKVVKLKKTDGGSGRFGLRGTLSGLSGSIYTHSVYVRALSGTGRITCMYVDALKTGGGLISSSSYRNLSDLPLGQWVRIATTTDESPDTLAGGGSVYVWVDTDNGECEFAYPQVEAKPFATSFVDGSREEGFLAFPMPVDKNTGTISLWIRPQTLYIPSGANWGGRIDLSWGRSNPNSGFVIQRYQDAVQLRIWDGVSGTNIRKSINWDAGDWIHCAIAWDSPSISFFVNGELVGVLDREIDPDDRLVIGGASFGGSYNPGSALYDELLILPYAASEEHIARLYAQTRPLYDEWVPLGVFWSTDWDSEELEAMVRARDRMELLRRTTYEPGPLKQNVSLYEFAQDVLTHAKMPSETYRLDPGLQDIVVPWGWVPPGSHRDALRIIAEAGLARAYCDRDGILRIQRLTTGQRVPLLDITPSDYFPPMRSPSSSVSVANRVVVTTSPLAPAGSPEEVARLTVEVPAGQTVVVRVPYERAPVISPSATVVNPPSGVSIVSATYGAASAEIEIRNASGNAATVTLSLSGVPLSAARGEQVVVEDEQSIRDLFIVEYQAPSNPLVQTRDHAEAIAQAILVASSRERRQLELEWRGNPALEAGDCVRILGMPAETVRQELKWAGALSTRITARRLS